MSPNRTPQARRGQALVEFTVMVGLFTVILLGGAFFAEAHIVGLKLNEAATFAAFDVTTQPAVRVRPTGEDERANSIANTQTRVAARYQDFDGTSPTGGPATAHQVATDATFTLVCSPSNYQQTDFFSDTGSTFGVTVNAGKYKDEKGAQLVVDNHAYHMGDGSGRYAAMLGALRDVFREDENSPSVACHAKATVMKRALSGLSVVGAGTAALAKTIVMCAPRNRAGDCGRYNVLVGDWAMEPGGGVTDAANDCTQRAPGGCNRTYVNTVNKVFTANMPDPANAIGRHLDDNSTAWTNELQLLDSANNDVRRFSFAGEEHEFYDRHVSNGSTGYCHNSSGVFAPTNAGYRALVNAKGGGVGREGGTLDEPVANCTQKGGTTFFRPSRLNGHWLGLPTYSGRPNGRTPSAYGAP